jgi:hypothetical protein
MEISITTRGYLCYAVCFPASLFSTSARLNMDYIRKLSFVANMAQSVQLRSQEDEKDSSVDQSEFLSTIMPELLILKGDLVTSDEYLERSLEEAQGRTLYLDG